MAMLLRILVLILAAVAAGQLAVRFRRPPAMEPPAPTPTVEIRDLEMPTPPAPSKRSSPKPPPVLQKPAAIPPPPAPTATMPSIHIVLPPPPPPPPPALTDAQFYDRYAGAVIQILCRSQQELFSASGVIVNQGGLVLTNAHVAEIVAKAGEQNCQARHGNPAERFSNLQIVFTASTTAKIPDTDVPQRDVAFLRLVEPKEPFTVAPVGIGFVERGATLLTLGYPSEFLESIATAAHSNLVFSTLRVDGYVDVDGTPVTAEGYVSKGGIVLQQGSSGTALFAPSGQVVGLIFATTKGATTADREGIALATPYVNRIMREETGQGLLEFIESH